MAGPLYWIGGTGSQSFQSASNWSTSPGGAAGAIIPSDADGVTEAYITSGTSNINSGLDNSSAYTGALYVAFDGTIGSAGSPLKTDCHTLQVSRVGGDSYFGSDVFVTAFNVFDTGTASVSWTTGTATTIVAGASGRLNISGTAGTVTAAGLGVSITGTVTTFTCLAGNHTSSATLKNVYVIGGTLRMTGTAGIENTTDSGVLYVYPDARYIHNSSGEIDFIEVYTNGTATAAGSTAPFVIKGGNRWVNCVYFDGSPVSITGSGATSPGRKGFGY